MPSASEVLQQIDTMEKKIARLENLVQQQNEVIRELIHKNTEMPNNILLTDNFFLRAFSIWGHNFVANLIITVVLTILFFCGTWIRLF
jgi:hypothetical protein